MSRCRRGVWGTEKLIGKLKDFIAKVKAYFDGLTTNTKAEAALLKEMRDGGLHYLERIVKAYDKAATAAVENYQGAETRSEGGETQYMARGKYWRPQLKRAEWDLLERRMNAEIKSGENFLDEATKWVYADEKGVQVFALYGIGDGTDATPLYAVGGKKAAACKTDITDYVEGRKNADRNGRSADSWIEQFQSKKRSRGRNLSEAQEQTGTAGTADELYGGQQGRNLGGYSGRGTENQRGVKDQFSIRDSEGRSLTEEQQDYFKDSKVRDAEGRLKVVYHGSGAVFTKFSADFMSQNGSSEGQGFYFTDYKPMAEGYSKKGGQLLEGYLDMKKPLSDSEVTLTSAEVRNLIKAVDPTGDDLVLNYDSKGGMGYPSRAWYNRSVEDTLRATMSTSDSDSEILAELANGMGDPGAVLKAAREVLGYDGYIVEGKYDNATVYVAFDSSQFKNVDNQSPTADPDIRYSIREIKGEDGTDYGKGVYLDSTLLEGLTDAERKEMMRERVKELGGQTITAYDPNGEAVDIRIAAPSEKFRNRNGRKVPVTKDLSTKRNGTKVKQESVVLADELIATSRYDGRKKAGYPHDWLDNNGKNDWQYWTTYIQDKNNTVWEATLNVAESANGVKYLYDIDPIEKVGQSVKSDTSTTSVGQSVKSDTSTTGDIVAQNQTESQAQIRSSTLSDRDVLRIAAQMAKNSESMLDIKKNHPASSLFRAYNSVPAASAEWLYWQYNLCWAECQHQGLAFFLRGSVNRFSVNFFSIEVITASLSFFRTIQVCCVDIEIKTDFTAHIRRTSILKYTKSLSIADQFPGFNIISVLFLTEFLCIFFDKCNSIFDDISRIHSDSTPLEHFFSMPCREAATLPDCTCARTMNFNPCAP